MVLMEMITLYGFDGNDQLVGGDGKRLSIMVAVAERYTDWWYW